MMDVIEQKREEFLGNLLNDTNDDDEQSSSFDEEDIGEIFNTSPSPSEQNGTLSIAELEAQLANIQSLQIRLMESRA